MEAVIPNVSVNEQSTQIVKRATTDITKYFKNDKFIPPLMGSDLVDELPMFTDNTGLSIYDNGVYQANGEKRLNQIIQFRLGEMSRRTIKAEIIDFIMTKTYVGESINEIDDGLINVKNGLLNWRTGELLPHDPKRFSRIQIPVEYKPNAKCPNVEKFLTGTLAPDTVPTMLEFFGYSLVTHVRYKKSVMLTGTGNNGKSIFLLLYTALIGEKNKTNISLQDLEHNRFALANLYGKLANIYADIPATRLDSSDKFKMIVAGDEIQAEYKGQDMFNFKPYAKMVFSANEKPSSNDVSAAFFQRWFIVPFENEFKGKSADKNLLSKITTPDELSGLLNLAIEGLRRLEEQGSFSHSETIAKAVEEYQKEADPLEQFIEECLNVFDDDEDMTVQARELYLTFVSWSKENGQRESTIMSNTKFGKRMGSKFKKVARNGVLRYLKLGIKYEYSRFNG